MDLEQPTSANSSRQYCNAANASWPQANVAARKPAKLQSQQIPFAYMNTYAYSRARQEAGSRRLKWQTHCAARHPWISKLLNVGTALPVPTAATINPRESRRAHVQRECGSSGGPGVCEALGLRGPKGHVDRWICMQTNDSFGCDMFCRCGA